MYNCTDYAGNETLETFIFIMSVQKVKSLKSLSLKSFFLMYKVSFPDFIKYGYNFVYTNSKNIEPQDK